MTTVAELDHIWPFDSVTLSHAPCVRCGASYGPDAGMCRVKMPKAQMSLNERLAAAYALDLVADDMRRDSATPAPAHGDSSERTVVSAFDQARKALEESESLAATFGDKTAFGRAVLALRAMYDRALELNSVLAHRTAQLDRLTAASVEAVEFAMRRHEVPGPQFVPNVDVSHVWLAGKCLNCGIDLDEDRVARTEPCDAA